MERFKIMLSSLNTISIRKGKLCSVFVDFSKFLINDFYFYLIIRYE